MSDVTVTKPPYINMTGHVKIEGTRDLSDIDLVVCHVTQNHDTFTLWDLARFFSNNGVVGCHFGVDVNGAVAQYASVRDIVNGTKHYNPVAIHIEQIALAEYSGAEWLHHRYLQLVSTAWIVSRVTQFCGVPLQPAGSTQTGRKVLGEGVTQHMWLPFNDHDDCGSGYPFLRMMESAYHMRRFNVPKWLKPSVDRANRRYR